MNTPIESHERNTAFYPNCIYALLPTRQIVFAQATCLGLCFFSMEPSPKQKLLFVD